MSNEVVNIFGDLVQAPAASQPPEPTPRTTYAKIPLAEMSQEEKRAYFRDRAASSRKRKREAEEILEEQRRLKREEEQQHAVVPEEKTLDTVPEKWEQAFRSFMAQDTTLEKIATELSRSWMYSQDARMVEELQRFIFGVEHKFIQSDEYLRVLGEYPDVTMVTIIKQLENRPHFNTESDALDLRKSPTFMALYADALWKANSLNDECTSLMDARMWGTVKAEFQRVCQD
jgi:hypothetical protein